MRLDANVNDPQGNAVRDGLHALGYDDVRDVRVGKTIDLILEASRRRRGRSAASSRCASELLANPVIEDFEIELEPEEA